MIGHNHGVAAAKALNTRIAMPSRASTSAFSREARQLFMSRKLRCRDPILRTRTTISRSDTSERTSCRRQLSTTRSHSLSTTSSKAAPTLQSDASPAPEAYRIPTTGILSKLPPSWVPYAELIRIDKQAGTNYLFLPCIFSTLLAAPLASPMASPLTVASTIALFYAGAIVMRGAGCTVNDLWDRNLDPKVARTRLRPIARGAVTVQQAIPFLGAQLSVGLAILLQFPEQCFWYAAPSLFFVAIYPLAKRVTYYPQFVLGLTFSWGAWVGFPALGVDLLNNTPALISAACLYSSCVAWTLIYDMIYAYQDIRDDAKAGIKSIALAHDGNAKSLLNAIAAVQVSLLAGAGMAIGAGPAFYLGVCGGAAATLTHMIQVVNLNDVKDCWAWFKRGAYVTGGAITVGLLGEYLAQYFDLFPKKSQEVIQS